MDPLELLETLSLETRTIFTSGSTMVKAWNRSQSVATHEFSYPCFPSVLVKPFGVLPLPVNDTVLSSLPDHRRRFSSHEFTLLNEDWTSAVHSLAKKAIIELDYTEDISLQQSSLFIGSEVVSVPESEDDVVATLIIQLPSTFTKPQIIIENKEPISFGGIISESITRCCLIAKDCKWRVNHGAKNDISSFLIYTIKAEDKTESISDRFDAETMANLCAYQQEVPILSIRAEEISIDSSIINSNLTHISEDVGYSLHIVTMSFEKQMIPNNCFDWRMGPSGISEKESEVKHILGIPICHRMLFSAIEILNRSCDYDSDGWDEGKEEVNNNYGPQIERVDTKTEEYYVLTRKPKNEVERILFTHAEKNEIQEIQRLIESCSTRMEADSLLSQFISVLNSPHSILNSYRAKDKSHTVLIQGLLLSKDKELVNRYYRTALPAFASRNVLQILLCHPPWDNPDITPIIINYASNIVFKKQDFHFLSILMEHDVKESGSIQCKDAIKQMIELYLLQNSHDSEYYRIIGLSGKTPSISGNYTQDIMRAYRSFSFNESTGYVKKTLITYAIGALHCSVDNSATLQTIMKECLTFDELGEIVQPLLTYISHNQIDNAARMLLLENKLSLRHPQIVDWIKDRIHILNGILQPIDKWRMPGAVVYHYYGIDKKTLESVISFLQGPNEILTMQAPYKILFFGDGFSIKYGKRKRINQIITMQIIKTGDIFLEEERNKIQAEINFLEQLPRPLGPKRALQAPSSPPPSKKSKIK